MTPTPQLRFIEVVNPNTGEKEIILQQYHYADHRYEESDWYDVPLVKVYK